MKLTKAQVALINRLAEDEKAGKSGTYIASYYKPLMRLKELRLVKEKSPDRWVLNLPGWVEHNLLATGVKP